MQFNFNKARVYGFELSADILDVFNEYGVQIMTPAYEGDTEQPKVVPEARWFEAPAKPLPSKPDHKPRITLTEEEEPEMK